MKRELRILLRMKYYRYVHGEEIWWKGTDHCIAGKLCGLSTGQAVETFYGTLQTKLRCGVYRRFAPQQT